MGKLYTDEKNVLIILALLKAHNIKKIIASPGTTNMALVSSMQNDPYFEMYSAVDERSAAYMACGLAAESGEIVVISCTGATASRNYASGLTEAYYRKLPILAITSTQSISKVGHHIAQVIDRSTIQKDIAKLSINLPIVKDSTDHWDCEINVNRAILELKRHGGGPVHINLPTTYSRNYETRELPNVRVIDRICTSDDFPEISSKNVGIIVGSHVDWDDDLTSAVDKFCEMYNAVVFCDHTSSYKGKYRLLFSLAAGQKYFDKNNYCPDLAIHLGEVSGDYYTKNLGLNAKQVWRVSEDGEIRDTFEKLTLVFETPEKVFFTKFLEKNISKNGVDYFETCKEYLENLRKVPVELPLSNIWVASIIHDKLPESSTIHFGILNSLRSWNLFEISNSIKSACNVGGFGIDGNLSSLLGASLFDKERIYFGIIGDLAFFYDMNTAGNRHFSRNIRILLINNGKGTEFRQYNHAAAHFGDDADRFTAAAGHFGNKSRTLVKNYAEGLGFEYLSAVTKEDFLSNLSSFIDPKQKDKPILFEVFTNNEDESNALEIMLNIQQQSSLSKTKSLAKKALGKGGLSTLKGFVKK